MISKTKINKKMKRKTNPELAEAIFIAKKNNLLEIAKALSAPTRKQAKVNLENINKCKGETIIIPGKVLSGGEISKKKKIYAIGFSSKAEEKLKKAGCEYKKLIEVLRKDNKLKGEIIW